MSNYYCCSCSCLENKLPYVQNRDIVDRLKAGATLILFVFALQLVSQSLFDSVKKRFIVGKQSCHRRLTGIVWIKIFDFGLKLNLRVKRLGSTRGVSGYRGCAGGARKILSMGPEHTSRYPSLILG